MSQKPKVWTALVTVYVLWGSTYLGIAVAGETIPPLFAASTRFITAGAIMAGVVHARGGSLRIPRRALVSCVMIGCLLPGANAILFFAERNVPTGLASLIIASVPLWVVVLRLAAASGCRGRRSPASASASPASRSSRSRRAERRAGASGSASLRPSCGRPARSSRRALTMPDDPFAATAYEMLAGGFVMLRSRSSPCTASRRRRLDPGWIYLVTFGSVVGYTAYVWLLANAPIGLVSTYAYVNPVVAISLGVLFRGEHLSWRLLIGAVIVVAAVALVVAGSRRRRRNSRKALR